MHRGYINLWRKLRDNPLWLAEPFTKGQAWVDLLLLANHKRNSVSIRGIVVIVEPGQVLAGEQFLADRWKWSRGKVRRLLRYLEQKTVQQIVQQKNNICTVISITNWSDYQCNGTADGTASSTTERQQTDNRKTTDGHTETCINTTNTTSMNTLSAPETARRVFNPPTYDQVKEYGNESGHIIDAQRFVDFYQAKGWMVGKNKMKDWKAAVRNWATREKDFNVGKQNRQHEREQFSFPEGEEVKNEM